MQLFLYSGLATLGFDICSRYSSLSPQLAFSERTATIYVFFMDHTLLSRLLLRENFTLKPLQL